jgi:hypothetical protein
LEDVDRGLVIAQQRQSAADLIVALHQQSTREALGSVHYDDSDFVLYDPIQRGRPIVGRPQPFDLRDESAGLCIGPARSIGAMFCPELSVVPTSHDLAGHALEPTQPTGTADPLYTKSEIPSSAGYVSTKYISRFSARFA